MIGFFLQYTTYTCEKNMNIYLTECIYNEWSEWTECSKPCDNGAQFRNRTLLNVNDICAQVLTETDDCNIDLCVISSKYINKKQVNIFYIMMGMKENTCLTLEHNK
jgi:hypothetical protein